MRGKYNLVQKVLNFEFAEFAGTYSMKLLMFYRKLGFGKKNQRCDAKAASYALILKNCRNQICRNWKRGQIIQ